VLARLRGPAEEAAGIWEAVPNSTRPIFGIALILLVCFLVIQIFVPPEPERGLVEVYLDPEESTTGSFLYSEAEVPTGQEFLQELIGSGDSQ
jgi:hypothetical protein